MIDPCRVGIPVEIRECRATIAIHVEVAFRAVQAVQQVGSGRAQARLHFACKTNVPQRRTKPCRSIFRIFRNPSLQAARDGERPG
jgi:hypothetical protein